MVTRNIKLSNITVRPKFNKYLFLVLLVPLLFVAYPLFSTPGIPVGNGDLPYIEISLYSFKKFWTWNEFGSYHGLETLPRYPIIAAFQIVNISPDVSSKLLIIGGFAIASFSFYVSCLKIFKNRLDIESIKFKIAAILGSLFYAYNVWSFHRIGHWYFWLGFAILPLFLVSVIFAFRNPGRWKYVLASVLLWSVASSTPHMAVFFALIFVALAILFTFQNVRRKRFKIKSILLKPISVTIIVYVMVNLYWIYPYLVSASSESFLWSAVVTEEITRELSRESDLLSVLRLIEGTFNMGIIDVVPDQASSLFPVWSIVSLVPPILAFSSVLFLRNRNKGLDKIILLFCALAIIGILLTMGSNAPFGLYSALLFQTPLTAYLQIIFREPDKWGFLVSLAFSFLIVISCFKILDSLKSRIYKRPNIRILASICFVSFIFFSFVIYVYPAYRDSMYNLYRPIVFPADFNNLSNNLTRFVNDKVFLTPYAPGNTTWVKDIGTFDLYHVASPVPNIAAYDYNTVEKYHKYLIDSVTTNKTSNVENIIYPLGTSYLLFHNDTQTAQSKKLLSTLMSKIDSISHVNDFGFFNLFRIGNNQTKMQPVNIPLYDSLISGGLDRFASLNILPTFSTQNSTLFFLDQKMKNDNDKPILDNAKYTFLSPSANDFILSFIDEKQVVQPFDATNNHEPEGLWSKAGADDPGNAWFTPYLEDLHMQNSDFDYAKGLVITEAIGAKIPVPFEIEDAGYHEIFMRFLTSPKGGAIRVYLDGRVLDDIDTRDDSTKSNFVWQNISSSSSPLYLSKGNHTLTIENIAGFNAVNLFAIPNSDQKARLQEYAYTLANSTKNIYILEAESNFHNNRGKVNDYVIGVTNITGDISNGTLENMSKGSGGLLHIPPTNDLISFVVLTNSSLYQPKMDLKLSKMNQTVDVYESDFDEGVKRDIIAENLGSKERFVPLAELRGSTQKAIEWIEEGEKDLSRITSNGEVGNTERESITIGLRKGNTVNWNIISTDYIGIDNGPKSIETGLNISARDVNLLHPKIIYYDENKTNVGTDFIFGGRNGTFHENTTNIYNLPQGTEYLKLQLFSHANPEKNSSYTINDVNITPLTSNGLENSNELSNTSIDQVSPISGTGSFRTDLKKSSTQNWNIISTDLIPVNDNSYYNASLDIQAKNVNQFHPKIIYYDENKRQITDLRNEEIVKILNIGLDGNFKKHYESSLLLPIDTKYIGIELFARPNPEKTSSYLLDNLKVEQLDPDSRATLTYPLTRYEVDDHIEGVEKSLGETDEVTNTASNDTSNKILIQKSKPIPVTENGVYNYSISFDNMNKTQDVSGPEGLSEQKSLSQSSIPNAIIAYFTNSSDVIQNASKYGAKASGGSVLTLDPNSEIYSELEILKPANYTIALRIGAQGINEIDNRSSSHASPKHPPSMMVEIRQEDQENNLLGKGAETGASGVINSTLIGRSELKLVADNLRRENTLGWIYLNNTFLERGKYEIAIKTNTQVDLDSLILYSVDDNQNQTIDNIFRQEGRSIPAYLTGYKKINPTKYEVNIKNASKPFIMTFAESYDPLWIAYASKGDEIENSTDEFNNIFRTNSIPMYSIVNGFYVNKTGDYTLTIEYQPQKWFEQGGIASIISLITFIGIVLFQEDKVNLKIFRHR